MPQRYTTYDPVTGYATKHTSLAKAKKEAVKQLKTYLPTHEDVIRVYKHTWTHHPQDAFESFQGYAHYNESYKATWYYNI
jgi:hypothetical protein